MLTSRRMASIRALAGCLLALLAWPAAAGRLALDGDTIMCDGERIRISNIDTAEMPPHARCSYEADLAVRAKDRLTVLMAGQVSILRDAPRSRDRYGRTLAHITSDGLDVGEVMVAEGLARHWDGRRRPWCN
jgi:micrococcal nuclease